VGNKGPLYATLYSYLLTGRAGGNWNGRRIASSTAAANGQRNTGLAAVINDTGDGVTRIRTTLAGEPVDVNTILIKYSYNGDANLDGMINADDYARIDNGYAAQAGDFYNGDFDYNGVVDSDDYFQIDRSFSTQGGALGAPAIVEAQPASSSQVEAVTLSEPAPLDVATVDSPASVVSPVTTIVTSEDAPRKTRRQRHHHRDSNRDLKVEHRPQPKWILPGSFGRR